MVASKLAFELVRGGQNLPCGPREENSTARQRAAKCGERGFLSGSKMVLLQFAQRHQQMKAKSVPQGMEKNFCTKEHPTRSYSWKLTSTLMWGLNFKVLPTKHGNRAKS